MRDWLDHADRVGGRIYTKLLAVALAGVAVLVVGSGILFLLAGGTLFGLLWVAGGIGFGLLARWSWRSRATLSESFDGHG
jgi:hypothetical protein